MKEMRAKIGLIWMFALAMAHGKPGDLDRTFSPELRAWVAPDHVTVAKNGRIWIGGGFEQAGASPTGDLVRLGIDGGIANEPATGYLGKKNLISYGNTPPDAVAPFLLTGGEFLLPGESGGWLRMSAAGKAMGNAFPGRLAGETLAPQFELAGKLWVIRYRLDGRRVLELRDPGNGRVDTSFRQAADWPGDPSSVVAGPAGTLWVLNTKMTLPLEGFGLPSLPDEIFQIDASGALIGATRSLPGGRPALRLAAGPGGAFRIEYGPDTSLWNYWPTPSVNEYRIDWRNPDGELLRYQNFPMPAFGGAPCWAEAADGSFLATSGFPIVLRRYHSDGSLDATFRTHQDVRSVAAVADGKWLLDGLRRINPDGRKDPTWTMPQLDRPARVDVISPLPDGRVLVAGDFATADGHVRNRLVAFLPNGKVDSRFMLDERISEWSSVAVSGRAIFLVTPQPVTYGDGITSNLVKLGLNGALMENYRPEIPPSTFNTSFPIQPVTDVVDVHAIGRGEILAQTYGRNEVAIVSTYRLKADGSQVEGFKNNIPQSIQGNILTRKNGTFIIGGVVYSAKGAIREDLNMPDTQLQPLCEIRGGVLFFEIGNDTQRRLKLWKNSTWVSSFRALVLDGSHEVSAVADDFGSIYLSATFSKKGARLIRLFPDGSIDRSFTSPLFASRERQAAGNWWKAEESGKIAWDVRSHQTRTHPRALLWHPLTKRLWVGGNFNVVDGRPRDGLARIHGGLLRAWSWR